jgi:Ni/Fe-hydrogenase 1 B-type cytochrome subunit
MAEQIRRVAVWSPRLRLAHWLMAGATLVLLATGWLLDAAPSLAAAAADYHYLAAAVLTFAIALRLWIGWFGQGAERFASLLLSDTDVRAARESLVFYLSFGKAPLPNWFAHNPLWKPSPHIAPVDRGRLKSNRRRRGKSDFRGTIET